MKRILTAIVAIPLVIYVIQWAPVFITLSVICIAMTLALHEYFSLTSVSVPFRIAGYLIAMIAISLAVEPSYALYLPAGIMLLLSVGLFSRLDLSASFQSTILAFFGAMYVGGLMSYLIALRMASNGADLLMMLFVVIWSADSFAYFAGRSFGRHKLAPVISPKKTWEGAVAGFLFSVVAAVVCKYAFIPELELIHAIALGAWIGIISQIGDLCESIIKRAVHMKDSGGMIPGHGGMLDRLDSLLFGAPAMYYYLSIFKLL